MRFHGWELYRDRIAIVPHRKEHHADHDRCGDSDDCTDGVANVTWIFKHEVGHEAGDVWEDDTLSPRDRSLVTITHLVALYRHNELGFHLKKGLENGLIRDEIIAAITHTAFYAGWPSAMTAINVARDVFEEA